MFFLAYMILTLIDILIYRIMTNIPENHSVNVYIQCLNTRLCCRCFYAIRISKLFHSPQTICLAENHFCQKALFIKQGEQCLSAISDTRALLFHQPMANMPACHVLKLCMATVRHVMLCNMEKTNSLSDFMQHGEISLINLEKSHSFYATWRNATISPLSDTIQHGKVSLLPPCHGNPTVFVQH